MTQQRVGWSNWFSSGRLSLRTQNRCTQAHEQRSLVGRTKLSCTNPRWLFRVNCPSTEMRFTHQLLHTQNVQGRGHLKDYSRQGSEFNPQNSAFQGILSSNESNCRLDFEKWCRHFDAYLENFEQSSEARPENLEKLKMEYTESK